MLDKYFNNLYSNISEFRDLFSIRELAMVRGTCKSIRDYKDKHQDAVTVSDREMIVRSYPLKKNRVITLKNINARTDRINPFVPYQEYLNYDCNDHHNSIDTMIIREYDNNRTIESIDVILGTIYREVFTKITEDAYKIEEFHDDCYTEEYITVEGLVCRFIDENEVIWINNDIKNIIRLYSSVHRDEITIEDDVAYAGGGWGKTAAKITGNSLIMLNTLISLIYVDD